MAGCWPQRNGYFNRNRVARPLHVHTVNANAIAVGIVVGDLAPDRDDIPQTYLRVLIDVSRAHHQWQKYTSNIICNLWAPGHIATHQSVLRRNLARMSPFGLAAAVQSRSVAVMLRIL
jgi:hypothetical protein